MRMSIPKKGLRDALTAMSLIVRSKASLPVLGCARIEVRGNRGEVRCTDLDQTLSWFVGDAAGEGAFLADLKELREYLRNGGSTGTVEFESGGTETSAVFHEGGIPVVRRFKGFSLDDWPTFSAPKGEGTKIGSEFFENVRKAAPSASDDTSRRVLRGVMLEPGAVVATNGRELVRLHCATGVKDGVVIPVTKFLQSARFAGNGGRVVVDEDNGAGRLVVSTDDWEYSVKRVEGTYPDYRRVIPKTKGSVLELSAASIAYLRKGLPLLSCGDEHQTVHLHADTAGLKVLASNFDGPRLEVGEGLKSGDPVSMSVDRRLLSRALELGFARFAFSGKDNYGPVAAYGGGGDVFVFMPLRADNSERIV
ncbi:MAG: hypothetical protein KAG97_00675, partial [Victivallales bacterium]|nr:hypothetical protein [Victivallales bacterium]